MSGRNYLLRPRRNVIVIVVIQVALSGEICRSFVLMRLAILLV